MTLNVTPLTERAIYMYQMVAYYSATRVQRGSLIYPVHSTVVKDEVEICNTHTLVRRIINLGKGNVLDLNRGYSAFAEEVLDSVPRSAAHRQLL
jgi:hypothetical protein